MEKTENPTWGHGASFKEAYVDQRNLDDRAELWLETIKPYTRHPFTDERLGFKPALLAIDLQRFFLDKDSKAFIPAGQAIVPRVRDLIQNFKSLQLPVIFTRHIDCLHGSQMPMHNWWGHVMRPEDPLTALHPDMECGKDDHLIVKHQYSAFHGTKLEILLKQLKITSLVITGVMTHLCCESTIRDAFMRGLEVVAVVDGMATLNETLHVSSLRGLSHGFALPTRTRDVLRGIGR